MPTADDGTRLFEVAMAFDNGWSSHGHQETMEPWYSTWPLILTIVGADTAAVR